MTDSETLCIHFGGDETDLILHSDDYCVRVEMPSANTKMLDDAEVQLIRDFMDRALKRLSE